jgi:hypothetical protein
MVTKGEDKKTGLSLLDDEVLKDIIEGDVNDNGQLKSPEACAAFAELARRSGLEGW